MPEYLAPGVYIHEMPSANKAIQAASTSTAGMVGLTERGPVGVPTFISSAGAFRRVFGGLLNHSRYPDGTDALPHAVNGFFANGGSRVYVVRVLPDDATPAAVMLTDGATGVLQVCAMSPGAWGNDLRVDVRYVTRFTTTIRLIDAARTAVTLASAFGVTAGARIAIAGASYTVISVLAGDVVVLDRALPTVAAQTAASAAAVAASAAADTAAADAAAVAVAARAAADGDPADLALQDAAADAEEAADLAAAAAATALTPAVAAARALAAATTAATVAEDAAVLAETAATAAEAAAVADPADAARADAATTARTAATTARAAATAAAVALAAAAEDVGAPDAGSTVTSAGFDLIVQRMNAGTAIETEIFTNLSLDANSPNYAPTLIGSCAAGGLSPSANGDSLMVRLFVPVGTAAGARPAVAITPLAGGSTGTLSAQTYIGTASDDPSERRGINALANEPGISLVAVPGQADVTVQNALIEHCNAQVYRFAVLDTPVGARMADARAHRGNFDSTRAALYYPWLEMADPFGAKGDVHLVPPSGHMIGIYARTDNARGVWKTPANEVVNGVTGFEVAINKAEQDILNPVHVNCMRDFRAAQRGMRIWGGRTLSSDAEWKYIAVRRTFLFIEQSLDAGLQYAVFEPNGKALWDTVRQSISGFLDSIWRQGGLAGATREEAFFVNVGYGVTMEQADLDNGMLIVEVGIAPLFPAEFVIIKISQKTLEALS
ncbi:MAG: phage tail sheath protein [Rhodobacterales bacterium]|nr:phage tail sheath protein [Rhodobacterales bacterium]